MSIAAIDAHYPRLAAYVAGLPAGLESYPECQVRFGTYEHVLIKDAGSRPTIAGLDPDARRLVEAPTPGLWVSEARFLAGILAIGDKYQLTAQQLHDWLLERNRELFRTVVYRAIMAFLSPDRLLNAGQARWSSFHKGTDLTFERTQPGVGIAELLFPPGLFDATIARVWEAVFVAAIERANARFVSATLDEVTATRARYRLEWR